VTTLKFRTTLGRYVPQTKDKIEDMVSGERVHDAFKNLVIGCSHLRLNVTEEHCRNMITELGRLNDDGEYVAKESLSESEIKNRLGHHVETIYSVLRAELGAMKIGVIPREKNIYCDPEWLIDSLIYLKYPDTVDEFQRAGRCFAFGENTACIFHLMRVTEFYLAKVGDSLGVPFNPLNWGAIGNHITKEMEKKYLTKTTDWKAKEPFYAEILTDIQAISRGHRNPALHELEKKYDEREALYMLVVIQGFATHVASKL
jgi:hypothetical protein